MKDLDETRLLDAAGTSDVQRLLLRSFANESPRREARERTLVALGLPVAAGGLAAAGAVSKASSGAVSAKGTIGLITWSKWGGAVLSLSALVGGGAYVAAVRGAPTPHATSAPAIAAQAQVKEPAQPSTQGPAVTDALPTLAPESLPRAIDAKPVAPSTARRTTAAAPSSNTLMEELSLMDRARQSFAQGAYGDSVRAVNAYETRYPRGSFVQEAEFIRVRALYEQHDPGAERSARAFLTQYPSSPYAPRVRTLVGSAP